MRAQEYLLADHIPFDLGAEASIGVGVTNTRGQLYKILSNPIYIGEIPHQGRGYKGLHTAIIDGAVWHDVQARLGDNRQGERNPNTVKSPSLLAGLIVDEAGDPLVATHACKGKVRYRYYVSRALQHEPDATSTTGMRTPAREIEAAVVARLAEALDDPLALLTSAGIAPEPDEVRATLVSAEKLAAAVRKKEFVLVRKLVAQVQATPRKVQVELSIGALASELGLEAPGEDATAQLTAPVRLTRTGMAVRLVHTNGTAATAGTPSSALVKHILQAREWWSRLATGETDITTIAKTEGLSKSWVSRVVRLNFLAPELVDEILAGTQPARLTTRSLVSAEIPTEWNCQREAVFEH